MLEEPWDPPAGRFDRARPLLLAADLAMYESKADGGHGWCFASPVGDAMGAPPAAEALPTAST